MTGAPTPASAAASEFARSASRSMASSSLPGLGDAYDDRPRPRVVTLRLTLVRPPGELLDLALATAQAGDRVERC